MNSRRLTARYLPCSRPKVTHLGAADCCIHPPGRNEMIAITPPKIFSKEVTQKQATPFFPPGPPHRQKSFLTKFPRPPPRGASHARPDDLEAFPSGLGHAASGTTYL